MTGFPVPRRTSPISGEISSGGVQLTPTAATRGSASQARAISTSALPSLRLASSRQVKLNQAQRPGVSRSSRSNTSASRREGMVWQDRRSASLPARISKRRS